MFNHKQTEDLLKQGRTSSHARIIGGSSAFANGTVNGMSAYASGIGTNKKDPNYIVNVSGNNNEVIVASKSLSYKKGSSDSGGGLVGDAGSYSESTSKPPQQDSKPPQQNPKPPQQEEKPTDNANTDKPQFSYDIFDYVELSLQYFADKTKAVADRITDYINKATKKALLDKQIKAIQTEIEANSRAASTYMDFAEKLAQAYSYTDKDGNQATVNIWSKFKRNELLQGKYQLDQMVTTNPKDAALVEGARAYLDYINKARDANNAIQELANTMRELQDQIIQIPTEKLERTLEIIENRIKTITGISSAMGSGMSGIKAAQRWINEATGVTKARENRDKAVAAAEAKKKEAEKKQKSSADDLANKKINYNKWHTDAENARATAATAINDLRWYNNDKEGRYNRTEAQKKALRDAINAGKVITEEERKKLGIRKTTKLNEYLQAYNEAIINREKANKDEATAKRLLDKAEAQNKVDRKAVDDAEKVVKDTRKAGNSVVAAEKKRRSAQAGTLMGIGRNSPSYIVQNQYLDVELDRMKKELDARLATQREQEGVTNTLQSQKTTLTGQVNKIKNTSEYKNASKSDKAIIDNAIKNGTKIDPTKVSSALSKVVSEWNNNILSLANVTTALQQAKDQEEKMKEELTQSALEVAEREQKMAEEKMENITNWYKAAIDYAKTQADTFSKMRNVWKERGYYISMEDLNNDSEQIDRHKTSLYDGISYIYRQFAKTANKEQTYGPVTEFTKDAAATNIKNDNSYKNASAADKKIIDDAMKSSSEIDITKLSSKWGESEKLSKLISNWNTGVTSSVFKLNQNYNAQIGKLKQMQKGYEEMVQKQTEQLEDMVAKGTILRGTEEHKKMLTDIEDAKTEVWALDGEIQKLYDSMREDVYFKPIENAIKQTETLRKATDQLKGFISQEMMYTTDGMFTKLGTVKYTMDVQSYKQAQDQLTQIIQEQQVINERFTLDRSFSMEEYTEKMQALEAQYRDTMGNLVSYRQAIIKDVTDRYQTEITYINKLIDAKKNELSKRKELYDYDKKLRKQNKDVQLIEQQIRALNGLTDAESRAQKARLEAQRAEMQEEIDDTVKEHIVNLRIDGLTDLSTKLQENYEKFVKDLSINIDSAANLVKNSADNLTGVLGQVNTTFNAYLKSFHPDAWQGGASPQNPDLRMGMGVPKVTENDLKIQTGWKEGTNLATSKYDNPEKIYTEYLPHYKDNLSAKEAAYQNKMQSEAEKIREQVGTLNSYFRLLLNKDDITEDLSGYASGTKSAKPGLHRINEKGPEAIITRRGVMLMPLKAGDGVIPADLTENLMAIAKSGMVPVQTPNFQAPQYNVSQNTSQNVTIHYDSLIKVDGNMDQSVVPQIEEIAKGLINNNSFKKNIYTYTAKEMSKDMRKAGH